MSKLAIALSLVCILIAGSAAAEVRTFTWDGNGDSNNSGDWSTAANWDLDEVPGEGDIAVLPAVTGDGSSGTSTRTITVTEGNPISVGFVSIPSGGSSYTNLVQVDSQFTVGQWQMLVAQGRAYLGIAEGATFTLGNNIDQWYEIPVLTGSGAFVKVGTATLLIGTAGLANDWTGTIDIQKGQLFVLPSTNLGNGSMITVQAGAALSCERLLMGDGLTLNGNGTSAFAGAFRFDSAVNVFTNATLSLPTDSTIAVTKAAGIFTFGGAVSGPGKLTKIGPGKLVLGTGSLGGVQIAQGTLEIVGTLTSDINVGAGAELIVADGGQVIGDVTWDTVFTAQGVGVSTPAVLTTGTVAVSITSKGDTSGGFKVTQTEDVPAPDSGWNPTGDFDYTIDGDTPDGQVTLYAWVMDSEDVVTGPATATIMYVAGQEIDKSGIVAESSSQDHELNVPEHTIDTLPDDGFRLSNDDPAPWLRLDLGSPHNVDSFIYMGKPDTTWAHRIQDYRLYVTNVDSAVEADWGTPVKTGKFANVPIPPVAAGQWGTLQLVQFDAPVAGKYVILRPISTYGVWPGAAEVWVFGTPAPVVTTVESFTAADIDESKPDRATFTNGVLGVDIVATPGDDVTITGYRITINDDVPPDPDDPEGWDTEELTQLILPPFQAEGTIILYAWVRDSSGYVAGKPYRITYGVINSFTAADADESKLSRTVLTSGNIVVAIDAVPGHNLTISGYKITVNDATPPTSDWQPEITEFTIPPETPEGITTLRAWALESNGFIGVKTYTITYVVGQEIDKSGIVAESSSQDHELNVPEHTIDTLPDDGFRWTDVNWQNPEANTYWLRLDLGSQHYVESFIYMGKPDGGDRGDHRIKDYKIYVTDVDSAVEGDWGAPVKTGTFANLPLPGVAAGQWGTPQLAKFDAPVAGRYVILRAINRYEYWPGAAEVWVYGTPVPVGPVITQFTVSDTSTGSTLFTNEALVNVAIAADPPEGGTVAAYIVTETPDEPASDDGRWEASVTSYTITGSGSVTLCGWAKDGSNTIGEPATAIIHYSTEVPAVSDIAVRDNGDGTATATWTTDIAAEGSVRFGTVALLGGTPNEAKENAIGTSHSVVLTGIAAGANYKIILVNNEIASAPIYWPKPWPIDGDANGDCRVNILDLIFIRNKLNQPVGTGDNWKADVNEDAKINILDLIYVRNKLNTSCP
ncbi:MAG TPA: discoidin domain-containing protein [Planctomycetota bacterium]|nr:discoidin domain-containing protein [Planctomycetota bacterium]